MNYRPYVQDNAPKAKAKTAHRDHRNFVPGCVSCDRKADDRSARMVNQRLAQTARTMSHAYTR